MWEWVNPKSLALEERHQRMARTEARKRCAIEAVLAWKAAGGRLSSRNSRKRMQERYNVGVSAFTTAENTLKTLRDEPDLIEEIRAATLPIARALQIEWGRRQTRDYARARREPYMHKGEVVIPATAGQSFYDLVPQQRHLTSRQGIYGYL